MSLTGSTSLGVAVLELAADVKGLRDDMAKANTVAKKGTDKMDKTVKQNTDSMSKSFAQFAGKVGLAAGGMLALAGAARSAIGTTKEAIHLSNEQIKAEESLAAALKGHNAYTLEGIELNKQYAKELQRQIAIGDEVVISIEKQLAAVTGLSGEALNDAARAVIQFSNAYGVELNAAAQLVAKTLVSSNNALVRYGVEIDATASKTQKLKDILDATSSGWGIATAKARTFEGKLITLDNVTGDYLETLGDSVTKSDTWNETLTKLAGVVEKLADEDRNKGIKLLAEDLGEIASSIVDIGDALTEGGFAEIEGFVQNVSRLLGASGQLADAARYQRMLASGSIGDWQSARETFAETAVGGIFGAKSQFDDLEDQLAGANRQADKLADNLGDAATAGDDLSASAGETAEALDGAAKAVAARNDAIDQWLKDLAAANAYEKTLWEKKKEEIHAAVDAMKAEIKAEREAAEELQRTYDDVLVSAIRNADWAFLEFWSNQVEGFDAIMDKAIESSLTMGEQMKRVYLEAQGYSHETATLMVLGFEEMKSEGVQAAQEIEQAFESTKETVEDVAEAASRAFTASRNMTPEEMEEMAWRRLTLGTVTDTDRAQAIRLLQGAANIREDRSEYQALVEQLRGAYIGTNPFVAQDQQLGSSPSTPIYVRSASPDTGADEGAI